MLNPIIYVLKTLHILTQIQVTNVVPPFSVAVASLYDMSPYYYFCIFILSLISLLSLAYILSNP